MDTLGGPVVLHLPRVVQTIGRMLTRQTVTIGHTTIKAFVHKAKRGETDIRPGAIHIKKHGKQTHGMMELMIAIGAILQVPVLDGMQEEVGATTIATHQLKEITQQRMLHNKTS